MVAPTSSPGLSNNNDSETNATPSPAAGTPTSVKSSPGLPPLMLQGSDSSKNLRGLNKPRCSTCGNVARSRCPFSCCKSCCFKAQNPCHIHVLKPNTTLADRGASANSTVPEQQPADVVPPVPPAKANSYRQLSSAFSQFNNVHIPLRSRKPLTRKDALVINGWRFAKLKDYKESHIEAENEAFDRYMQNITLLEEVFDVNCEKPEDDAFQMTILPPTSGEKTDMVPEMKAKLRSNPVKIDAFRKRIRFTVDDGLRKLQVYASTDGSSNVDNEGDIIVKEEKNLLSGRTSALMELNDKLNRARNEEDLKLCIQMRHKIRGQPKINIQKKTESSETLKEQTTMSDLATAIGSEHSLLKPVTNTEIDQDVLVGMDLYFLFLEAIEDL